MILYSTHCPQCILLEKKIKEKEIDYEEVNDIKLMEEKGFMSAPILEVDGVVMRFKDALNYIASL